MRHEKPLTDAQLEYVSKALARALAVVLDGGGIQIASGAGGVLTLSLFGSHARGTAGPESDVDVVVEFEGSPTFDRYMDVKMLLEDVLESRVDLVTRASLKPRMRKVVDAEAIRVT